MNATPAHVKTKPVRKRAPRLGVEKGMKVRLYPTVEQEATLLRWMGACRWTWNWALGAQHQHYRSTGKHLSTVALSRALTVMLKTGVEAVEHRDITWLRELPRTSLTCTLNSLRDSWKAFFDGCSGKRPDKPGQPRFKQFKDAKKSISFQVDSRHASRIDLIDGSVTFPLLGKIAAKFTEVPPGELVKLTIARQGGVWWVALGLVNVPHDVACRLQDWETVSGEVLSERLDHRVRHFVDQLDSTGFLSMDASIPHGVVFTSDGKQVHHLVTALDRARTEKVLAGKKRVQRRNARKERARQAEYNAQRGLPANTPLPKGAKLKRSKRQQKLNDKIAKIDLHLKNVRQDRSHQFTTWAVRNHHTCIVETLLLSAMAKALNTGLRRRFHEASMGEILRQLEYKCQWYGRTFIQVDRWFPSSKRCSNPACHQKNTALKLSDRAWTCPHCHASWDRDENAAFNLWQEGRRLKALLLSQDKIETRKSAVGSTVVARPSEASVTCRPRRPGGAGDVSGSDLPGTLEASGMAATVQRRGRKLASMNREAVLAPGRQTPETNVGMEKTSVSSE